MMPERNSDTSSYYSCSYCRYRKFDGNDDPFCIHPEQDYPHIISSYWQVCDAFEKEIDDD
jgi:hypothetical protein